MDSRDSCEANDEYDKEHTDEEECDEESEINLSQVALYIPFNCHDGDSVLPRILKIGIRSVVNFE